MKAAFYTLGCKVNQNETGALKELFRQAGHDIVEPCEAADIFVVNSCTVTVSGDAKSRRALNRARGNNPGVVTVLTGCSPQAFPQMVAEWGADVITGTVQRSRILENIQKFLDTGERVVDIAPMEKDQPFEDLPFSLLPGRTRAFVKIQDGCNRRCAYCIIPTARGPARSRPAADVLSEVEALAGQGYAEVVFSGINLSDYGRDTATNLAQLTEAAAQIRNVHRIRLSSLEPDLLTDEQIAIWANTPQFSQHFHISLQSGCDATLRRMRRPYTTAQFAEVAEKLRKAMPTAGFTTDIIVGFPGETENEFQESMNFVREMGFLKVHVFPYSARTGTPAAEFDDQLRKSEKTARASIMQKEADDVRAQWIGKQLGSQHQVLLETPLPNGTFTGYTGSYIPVAVAAPHAAQGDIVTVKLGAFNGERCTAEII